MKCMVSVIMLTYKHEDFIKQAIEGVLEQKVNFKIELIIADDQSPDGTEAVVKNIIEVHPVGKQITYIRQKQNVGPFPNFAHASKLCKGKYIALCEGDDFWGDPFKLQKQIDFLENHPDYVLNYHNAQVVDEKGTIIKSSNSFHNLERDLSGIELTKGTHPIPLTLCYRNLIKEFPEEIFQVISSDTFLVSLLGRYGNGKYLESINPANYRIHSGGIWSLRERNSKLANKIITYKYLAKYYNRIGNPEVCQYFKKQIQNHQKMLFVNNWKNRDFSGLYNQALNYIAKD